MPEYSSDSNESQKLKKSKRIAAYVKVVLRNVKGYKLVHVRNGCRIV